MSRALGRLMLVLALTLAVIMAGVFAWRWLTATNGDAAAAVHLAESPLTAALALGGVLAVNGIAAIIATRAGGRTAGFLVAGIGLAVFAMGGGTYAEFLRQDGTTLGLMLECAASACVLAAWAWAVERSAGGNDIASGSRPLRGFLLALASAPVMLSVVWLVARSELKGQTIAAAVIGTMIASLAATIVSPSDRRLASRLPGFVLIAAAGYGVAWLFVGAPTMMELGQSLSPLHLPMPLDYVAGVLLGGPIGAVWGRSFTSAENPARQVAAHESP